MSLKFQNDVDEMEKWSEKNKTRARDSCNTVKLDRNGQELDKN